MAKIIFSAVILSRVINLEKSSDGIWTKDGIKLPFFWTGDHLHLSEKLNRVINAKFFAIGPYKLGITEKIPELKSLKFKWGK